MSDIFTQTQVALYPFTVDFVTYGRVFEGAIGETYQFTGLSGNLAFCCPTIDHPQSAIFILTGEQVVFSLVLGSEECNTLLDKEQQYLILDAPDRSFLFQFHDPAFTENKVFQDGKFVKQSDALILQNLIKRNVLKSQKLAKQSLVKKPQDEEHQLNTLNIKSSVPGPEGFRKVSVFGCEGGRWFGHHLHLSTDQKCCLISMFIQLNLTPQDVDNDLMIPEYFSLVSQGSGSYSRSALPSASHVSQMQQRAVICDNFASPGFPARNEQPSLQPRNTLPVPQFKELSSTLSHSHQKATKQTPIIVPLYRDEEEEDEYQRARAAIQLGQLKETKIQDTLPPPDELKESFNLQKQQSLPTSSAFLSNNSATQLVSLARSRTINFGNNIYSMPQLQSPQQIPSLRPSNMSTMLQHRSQSQYGDVI